VKQRVFPPQEERSQHRPHQVRISGGGKGRNAHTEGCPDELAALVPGERDEKAKRRSLFARVGHFHTLSHLSGFFNSYFSIAPYEDFHLAVTTRKGSIKREISGKVVCKR
jgi:hypothetical protein